MQTQIDPRHFDQATFLHFGLEDIAFVKPVVTDDGEHAFAIHGADGRALAVAPDRDQAMALVRQNDLTPVDVQ